jgi:hypothetical protein
VEAQRRVSKLASVDHRSVAMQQQHVFLAREVITPEAAIFADDEVRVIAIPRPGKRRRRVEPDLLFAEGQLAAFEDEPEQGVTKSRGTDGRPERNQTRVGEHQPWHDEAGDHAGGSAAERDLVGDDVMLEVDERGRDSSETNTKYTSATSHENERQTARNNNAVSSSTEK